MSSRMVPLGLAEDHQWIREKLDLAEGQPILDEHLEKLIQWRFPEDWQTPEAGTEVQDPPWHLWVEWYIETETWTILDWMLKIPEIRHWWNPHHEFHRLVASKLIVMDWLEDPRRVMIELSELARLGPEDRWDQVLRLQEAVDEVTRFEGLPLSYRPRLIDCLEKAAKRSGQESMLANIAEIRDRAS